MAQRLSESQIRKIVRNVIKEDKHHKSSYMAKSQLFNIVNNAIRMFSMVEDGEQLDDWMESKIAQIDLMMSSVTDSFTYDEFQEHYGHHEEMCPQGMYWCERDQMCKPMENKMDTMIYMDECPDCGNHINECGCK